MFKNYLKLALRNFKRRKGHTFINILGLAIAAACCIFIGLYVQYELSYDTFSGNSDRLFRVTQTSITPQKTTADAATPVPLGPTLKSEYPRLIDQTVRLYNTMEDHHTFMKEDSSSATGISSYIESNFFFADSTFFEVFGVDLIRGNPKTALKKPLSLVLTPAKAREFFGDEDPIGQTLYFQSHRMNMTVTAIMEPLPPNSHIKADILASMNSLDKYYSHPQNFYADWFATNLWTYVLLKNGIRKEELARQFPGFQKKYLSKTRDKSETLKTALQPVESIHLQSHLDQEMGPNSSIFYVYLFATAALLLLIIACINFMNLATARAAERSREVGMRKALGASRAQLFMQFMGESFLLCLIAVIIAVLFVAVAMPLFSTFVDLPLIFKPLQNPALLWGIILLYVGVSFFAGLYPALYLSGFQPRQILQGDAGTGRGGAALRKGLVVVQFAMSVILIVGTVVVFLQLKHMQHKDLGFDKSHLAIMPIRQNLIDWEYPSFKQRVEKSAAVRSVTGMGKILGSADEDPWKIAPAGKGGKRGETNFTLWVTHDFVKTYGLHLVAGRAFSKEHTTDGGRAIIINQKMVQKLGYSDPHDALGELFYYTTKRGKKNPMQVIGVVKDFNYTSVKKEIKPLVICISDDQATRLGAIMFTAVKIAPGRTKQALAHIKEVWNDIDPIDPFNYTFQQQDLKKIYALEATTTSVMTLFMILCIVVACLGLFGLASFTASQRTKEIGIRKSLGASVNSIVLLLSKEYIKLVLIANIIAWPFIYYLAHRWLQDFASRINLGWNMVALFFGVGLLSLLICLATVSFQSVKAALVNPVDSIRQE